MKMHLTPRYLSKEDLYKEFPRLYYGVDGKWFMVMTEDGRICALTLSSFPNPSSLLRLFSKHTLIEKKVKFPQTVRYLLAGTPFQHQVWKALLNIPRGVVETYQDLARRLSLPKAVRAVANAVGANPISPVVPCHRVVGTHHQMRGYHWGIPAKVALLREEGVDLSSFKGLSI